MKFTPARLLPALTLASLLPAAAVDTADLADPAKRRSYAIGVDIARNLSTQDLGIDPKLLAAGLIEGFAGKAALDPQEVQKVISELQTAMSAKMRAKQATVGQTNKQAGEAYLAANAKKAGVKTTASGLQYEVLKSGSGKSPGRTDKVRVQYEGSLIDGTVFDSSIKRGEPAEFPVDRVIPGWTEALQLMKEGDKWRLVIPSPLAYGPTGAGAAIGPNSVLIFEVELLAVNPPAAAGN